MNHVESDSVNAVARWRMSARILAIFIVFIMVSTAFAALLASAEDTPGIWTSKDEYSPGETVEIYGGGFVKWVPVTITISHPDIVTQTFTATPDMYGRFVCTDYVAEIVNSYNVSVTVTATQVLAGGNRVATTHFWDPAAFIEGWTLMPHQRFTTGDVKGYNEGDSVPMIVVLNKKQLHSNSVIMSIGVDFIDTTPLHVPTYGIDYLTQYWLNPPTAPFNTYTNSSSPFFVSPTSGTLSGVHRDANIYDAGTHITEQVWTFTFTFSSSASCATIRFGAHLAVSDVPNGTYGASFYPGESLHVRIVAMSPDVNNGNRDVPISVGQLLGPPHMTLEKSVDPTVVIQGDIVTYTIHFSNIGQGDATCVNLWDVLPGPGVVSIIPGSFLYWDTYDPTPMTPIPGPTITSDGWSWFIGEFSGTGSPTSPRPVNDAYLTFQAVVLTGQEGCYWNYVHLTYEDGHGGQFPQLDASAKFCILGYPSISIVKSGPLYAHVGDVVTYTYTVTNTGNIDLVSVDVVDNVAGNVQLGFTLLAHQSVTLTKTYTIQPGDPHFLTNTVIATGTDTHGRIVTATSQWTLEILRPHIVITKTSDLSCAKVGESVWYTISWSNPAQWDTTLYNVTVYDPMLMASPIIVGTLPPGGSGQVSIKYTVTGQYGDPQINTATANGEDIIHGHATDSASVRLDVVHPAVEITKTANKACAAVGEMVIYTITVTNPSTADVWLNGTYGDSELGLSWTFQNLMPGQSLQQTVAAAMPDMNEFTNDAWVSAQDHQLHVVSGRASVRVDVVHPAVQITKTADKSCAAVGEVVQFTITVTNPASADVWLNGTVNDPAISSSWVFTNLKPGQHITLTASYAMPDGPTEFINTAMVDAFDHQQHEVTGAAYVRVDIVHPDVQIVKTASLPCAGVGEEVTFTITVTNPATADVWLNGTVSDPALQSSWSFANLMPGHSFVATVSMLMPAGQDDFINTATVVAFDHQQHEVTGTSSVRVDIVHPAVEITKTADKACAAVGEDVIFDIVVTNPASADVWLNGTVTDPMLGQTWTFTDLQPGQTFEVKVTVAMPAGMDDYVNTAMVDAFDHQKHEVRDSSSVRVDIVHPAVQITKTADKACAAVGEQVVFTITVSNPGSADVWLNGTISDPMVGGLWPFANLKPGQQVGMLVFVPMPDGPTEFINTASVTATDHQGHTVSAQSEPVRVDIVHPAVQITKIADKACAAVDEPVTFTITVTNPATADVWLNGTVSDPAIGMTWSFFDLMPGQTFQKIVTVSMPAGVDDFVNTAMVDAFDHQRHEVTGSASVRVDVVHPDVLITKTSDKQCAGVGETVTYTITVTNPANADVWLNGTYGDYQLGVSWSFQNLMPGQSVSQTVTAAMPDVDAFFNEAWVDAFDHQNHEVRDFTSIRVDVVHPDITITKTADRTLAHDGDIITYAITVSVPVTADVWMNGTVTDTLLGFVGTFSNLQPGQSMTWFIPMLVTPQMPTVIHNTATVVAFDHQQHEVTKDSSWTVTILRPSIHVTKIGPLFANVGDVITYFVNVTNTGNCDLYNVVVIDSLVGPLPPIGFLAMGATVHLTYTYTIPPGTGNIDNTVTASGEDLLGLIVTDHASWTVQRLGSVLGFKAADLNQNGNRDLGEPGLMNWVIVLTGITVDNEVVTRTTLTDSLGFYEFTNLKPGTYSVSEVMQAGWVHISPATYSFSLIGGSSMALDFLNLPLGSISGAKFDDTNMNGVWDVGEVGVPGWNITLTGTTVNGDPVLIVATTDGTGHYSFTNLLPGVYYVSEESKAGWFPTTPSPLTVDVSALQPFTVTDQNFGNVKYGSITGFKWLDINMNGYQDGSEPRLPGWTIILDGYQTDGTHVHLVTVTDACGNYAFLNLKPGVYTVTEVMQNGWVNITPISKEITIVEGSDVTCAKFGNLPLGSITGWKFYDWDLDMTKDGNEPGIPGWKMTLTGWLSDGIPAFSQNGATPVGPIVVYTDANGVWSFNGLLPGEYFVTEEQVTGWQNTTPIQLHFEITPIWTEDSHGHVLEIWVTHVIDVKFGNVPLTCITGTKYNDLNGNGIRDPNEPGIPGWLIEVYGGPNNVHFVLTDQDGNYKVCGLLPGIYLISEESRDGWTHTTPALYTLDDSSPRAPASYAFDFGNFQLGKITGSKWEDMNGNGILDAGDQPIQGWTIYLDMIGGGTISTTTDVNGNFEFDNLMAGQYVVREENRADWVHMNQASYGVTVVSGTDVQLPPFLNVHLSKVTGCKFEDLNGNGIRDPNEPGVPGWTIYLIWDGDPTVYQTTTNADGCYQFTGLMPDGFYEVYESTRPDWTPTNTTWEVFSLVSGTTHHVHDFANFHNAVITVFKYDDKNSNGIYDNGDTPLQGWHFTVSGSGISGGSNEVVTDAFGFAYQTVTAAGPYTVSEIGQAGWTPTTATLQNVVVTSGTASPPVVMFGNFKCVTITLFKYEDVNSDGIYEQGIDCPIEGWAFFLFSENGLQLTVLTDENGFANVTFCASDMWFVSEEHRDGWIPVNPQDGRAAFLIVSGHAYQFPTGLEQYVYEFGNFKEIKICVFKFWDKCSDGYYTPGLDVPLSGWLIGVFDSAGNLVAFGYTNSDGRICFVLDHAGTYTVKEEDRAGWSHISPASGSWTIDVVSGDEISLEFANYEDVQVPIFKYEDVNCDGIYDQGDIPIAGWHFDLVRTGDGTTFSGVTDANGMLTIMVNRSGIYRLTEESRPGWTPVNPADGKMLITVTSGTDVPLLMFGNFHNVLIPIFKYSDADGNGIYDPQAGDSPIQGWHFYLWKETTPGNWVLVSSNVTDVNGHTEFILTDCGHYKITEESREGWFVISPLGGQYTVWVWSGEVFEIPFSFANFKLGTITVYKYNDLNGNGIQDPNEPGLPGWTIEIQSQGPFFWYQFGTTDANGQVVFTGLPPGWFTVWEDGQPGWIPTSPSSVSVQVMGDTHAVVTFLNFQKGCLEGYKYNDVNGNGVYDPGVDTPIQGWTITLMITTGIIHTPDGDISAIAIVGTTLTDENGHYEFCDLGPGIYIVAEEQRQPWVPMTPTSYQHVLMSGEDVLLPPFLNFAPGEICGYKYEDVNSNGVYDPGIDRPIEGWKISLIEDSLPDVLVTYTNADGFWCFENLRADYYLVFEEQRDHWTPTTSTWAEVTITSGLDYHVAPFLNFHNVCIPIFKYNDVNGDGIYEEGLDTPIQGWSFTVTGPGLPGGSVTVQTDQDGRAHVEVNSAGTYTVTEQDVAGWTHTTPSSFTMTVLSGDKLSPLRFGNFQLGRVEGYKSYDWNLNGNRDLGEMGLQNWVIVLQGVLVGGGTYLQTRLTDSTGFYEFTNLPAGIYQVSEVSQPGWVPTSPPSVVFGITSGWTESVTFNNAVFGIIEGYKFYDKDMDGVMDGNEPGLQGWTIHLDGVTDHGVPVHETTTTDANGHYMFENVQPGNYQVTEELPGPEWQATTPSPQIVDTSGALVPFDQTVNIGNVRFATIWGYKFLDTYCQSYPFWPNGIFDPWEFGIGNWQITLQGYTDTGVRVDLVTYTDNSVNIGFYQFNQVLPGTYWINETLRHGFAATTPYAVLINVYPFPQGPVVIRRDFGNLLPSADPTMPFLLQKGWNLWSSPLTVTGLTAKGLLGAIGPNAMAVTKLDTSQGKYFSYVSGYSDSYDFPIALGQGYYVYVKKQTSFTLTGEIEQSSSTTVLKGWNIVGYTKLQPMKASELLASVGGSHAKAVTYLDATTGVYHSYVKGYSAAYDFAVTQGRSYFLWVDGSGTLTL